MRNASFEPYEKKKNLKKRMKSKRDKSKVNLKKNQREKAKGLSLKDIAGDDVVKRRNQYGSI